jgi:hypothetical protein
MMKTLLTLLGSVILLIPCSAQKVMLQLNLEKGGIYSQNLVSNLSINESVNGQQINILMTIDGKMSYKVIEIQDNIYDMEVRYVSLNMKMTLSNVTAEFSSEKNDESDIMSSLLASIKDKPFMVKMTKSGKVNEVKNIDVLFSNMFDKLPQLNEAQKQQVMDQLKQAYGEKAFKGNIEMCSAIFSDAPVSRGDKWTVNTQLEAGMAAKMETVYELKEITDNYYQILGNSEIATADKDAYVESNGMKLKYDLSGTMISDIQIDKISGWVKHALINQSMKGTAYVKESPQLPNGLAIPMILGNEMTITE